MPFFSIKPLLCLTILILCTVGLSAQQISGTIKANNGEPLIGAAVFSLPNVMANLFLGFEL